LVPETIEIKQVSEVKVLEEAPTEIGVQIVSEVVPEASDIDQALQELSPYVPAYVASVRDRLARGEDADAILQEVLDVLSAVRDAVKAREDLLRARAIIQELVGAGVAGAAIDEASRIINQSIDNVENTFSRLSKATTADEVKGIAKEAVEVSGRGLEALKAVRSLVADLIFRLAEALSALKTQFNLSKPVSDLRAAAQAVLSAASGAEILAAWSLKRVVEYLYRALRSLEGVELPKDIVDSIQVLIYLGRYADAIGEISKGIEIAKKLAELRGKITEALKGLEELETYVKSVVERLKKLGIEDLEKLLQEVQRIREIYGRIVELRKKAEDLIARIEATIPQETRGGIRDQLADIRKRIFEAVEKIKKASTPEDVEAVEKDLASVVEELQKLSTQIVSQTLENLRKALEEAWMRTRKILETAAKYREMLGQDPSQALENLRKRYEELRKRLEDIATGKSQENVENLRKDIDSFIKDAGAEAENTAKALINIYGRISERAKKLAELAREVATPLGMQIPEIPPPPTAAGEIAQALENLTKTETQILDILKKAMLQRIDTLINAYSNRPEAWAPTAVEILREMRSVVETWNIDQALRATKGYLAQLQRIEDISKKAFYNVMAGMVDRREVDEYAKTLKDLRDFLKKLCRAQQCSQEIVAFMNLSDQEIERLADNTAWARTQVGLLVINPRESALVRYLAALYTSTPEVFNALAEPIRGLVLKALRGEDLTAQELETLVGFAAANRDVIERVLSHKQPNPQDLEKLARGEEPKRRPPLAGPLDRFLSMLSLKTPAEELDKLLADKIRDPTMRNAIVSAIMGAALAPLAFIPGVGWVLAAGILGAGIAQTVVNLQDPVLKDLVMKDIRSIVASTALAILGGAAGGIAGVAALRALGVGQLINNASRAAAVAVARSIAPRAPWLADAMLKFFSTAKIPQVVKIQSDVGVFADEASGEIVIATKDITKTIRTDSAVLKDLIAFGQKAEGEVLARFAAWADATGVKMISWFATGETDDALRSLASKLGIPLERLQAIKADSGSYLALYDPITKRSIVLSFDDVKGLGGALEFIKYFAGRGVRPEELNPLLQRLFNTELTAAGGGRYVALSSTAARDRVFVKILDTVTDKEFTVQLRSKGAREAGAELAQDLGDLARVWRELGSPGDFEAFARQILSAAWKEPVDVNFNAASPIKLVRAGDVIKIVKGEEVVSTTVQDIAKALLRLAEGEKAGFDPVILRTILETYANTGTVKTIASFMSKFLQDNIVSSIGEDMVVVKLNRGSIVAQKGALKLFEEDPAYATTLLGYLAKPGGFFRPTGRGAGIFKIELQTPLDQALEVMRTYGVPLGAVGVPPGAVKSTRELIVSIDRAITRASASGDARAVQILSNLKQQALKLHAVGASGTIIIYGGPSRTAIGLIPAAAVSAADNAEAIASQIDRLASRGTVSVAELENALGKETASRILQVLTPRYIEEPTTITSRDISTATIYNVESVEKPVQTAVEIPIGLRATVVEEPETITSVDLAVASIYGAEEITKPLPQRLTIPTPMKVVIIEEPETIVSRDYAGLSIYEREEVTKPIPQRQLIPAPLRVVEIEEPETIVSRDYAGLSIYEREEVTKPIPQRQLIPAPLRVVEIEEPETIVSRDYLVATTVVEESVEKPVQRVVQIPVRLRVVEVEEPGTMVLRDHLRSAIYMQEVFEEQVRTAARQDIKLKTVEVEEPVQTLRQAYISQQVYSEEPAQKSVADTGVFDVYLVVVPVPGTKVTYVPEEEGRPPPPTAVGVSPAAPIPPALGGAQPGPQQIMPRGKGVRERVVV
jgi:cytochrome c556